MMKRFTLWNCALSLVATMAVVHTDDWEHTLEDIAQCVGYVRGFADAENKP
jgi:hypothetical protein